MHPYNEEEKITKEEKDGLTLSFEEFYEQEDLPITAEIIPPPETNTPM